MILRHWTLPDEAREGCDTQASKVLTNSYSSATRASSALWLLQILLLVTGDRLSSWMIAKSEKVSSDPLNNAELHMNFPISDL